ncbi:MAG: nucleotidyl transferase AbiEii/AbiGii toxin family protein [Spirochaetia bacterium]|jgi:predicted nucleotidyltransferase component of viral defense system|nr:nucleotidyl transferase AbiEii/AbiGii toxin family protein [Spirochaetia bacterium]
MNLFDSLVEEAIKSSEQLAGLRTVVEKEILHHDILREMGRAGYLSNLTFIGGTCLRNCYGSVRLSEDLDFTGGSGFRKIELLSLGDSIIKCFSDKYGLKASVSAPLKEKGNVDTWKIRIITKPERPDLPAQKINIDICALPSHDRKPSMLINHYNIDMGTSGLILFAESREEILADKITALALRPNRIMNRDLWDISWLNRQNIHFSKDLLNEKLKERKIDLPDFRNLLSVRFREIEKGYNDFVFEMRRFLPSSVVSETVNHEYFWTYLLDLINDIQKKL